MDKFLDYDDVEPLSEADAKAEYDEWMKQAIMDDKAQQEDAVRFKFDITWWWKLERMLQNGL